MGIITFSYKLSPRCDGNTKKTYLNSVKNLIHFMKIITELKILSYQSRYS